MRSSTRPRRVILTFSDPFDGTVLSTADLSYNKRMSAASYYTRTIRRIREGLKKVFSDVLQDRTPMVRVHLVP